MTKIVRNVFCIAFLAVIFCVMCSCGTVQSLSPDNANTVNTNPGTQNTNEDTNTQNTEGDEIAGDPRPFGLISLSIPSEIAFDQQTITAIISIGSGTNAENAWEDFFASAEESQNPDQVQLIALVDGKSEYTLNEFTPEELINGNYGTEVLRIYDASTKKTIMERFVLENSKVYEIPIGEIDFHDEQEHTVSIYLKFLKGDEILSDVGFANSGFEMQYEDGTIRTTAHDETLYINPDYST